MCVFSRLGIQKKSYDVCVCVFVILSSVVRCLAVTSCLCDADSFSVSLQTLPSACEEGCEAFKLHNPHSSFSLHASYHSLCFHILSHVYLIVSPLLLRPVKIPLACVSVHRVLIQPEKEICDNMKFFMPKLQCFPSFLLFFELYPVL